MSEVSQWNVKPIYHSKNGVWLFLWDGPKWHNITFIVGLKE